MSTAPELNASIDEYTTQLQQVDDAIAQQSATGADCAELVNLRADLTELLRLTRESLSLIAENVPPQDVDPLADEFDQFVKEMREVDDANRAAAVGNDTIVDDTTPTDDDAADTAAALERIKLKLTRRLGDKCAAPHTHAWGARAYHNAMVCGLDDLTDYTPPIDERTVNVKVLFTQPTHREMVPCAYYLDGECRFEASQCRFSHGELVPFGELRPYREPDYRLLRRIRWPVLVKRSDRMWHKAHTVAGSGDSEAVVQRMCRVRLDESRAQVDVDYADVLPMYTTEDGSEDDDDDDDENDEAGGDVELLDDSDADNCRDTAAAMHRSALIERSLLTTASDRPLGEWEKHTKGFGSRMMQKYGYVLGTGLGNDGAGIVVPISAQVLPPGRSLDHCMALREQANGDSNLFSVERRVRQRERKLERQNAKAYERETRRTSAGGAESNVFSFINESVFAGLPNNCESTAATSSIQNRRSGGGDGGYKQHSTKNLNVASFQLGEDIRRKEQEIQKAEASLGRQAAGTTVHNRLQAQLADRQRELHALRHSEVVLQREQTSRKDKTKLTVF